MDPGGLEYIRPDLYCCGFSGLGDMESSHTMW